MSDQATVLFLLCIYVTLLAARCCAVFFAHESRAMNWIDSLRIVPAMWICFIYYSQWDSQWGLWKTLGLNIVIIAPGDLLVWFM